MLRKLSLFAFATLVVVSLAGCELYFGDRDDDDDWYTFCDDSGCYRCNEWECYPQGPGGDWGYCTSNDDCAAGCYCATSGVCIEAGFCETDSDCGFDPAGNELVCDDRSSCVPGDSVNPCTEDAACPVGSYCDEATGTCTGTWTCSVDEDCGAGLACDERGTCVPMPCAADDECMSGTYCDEEPGECVATDVCGPDGECPEGLVCDWVRNTCVPPGQEGCTEDSQCTPGQVCDAEEQVCRAPTCDELDNEAACLERTDCEPVYGGVNCTDPAGGSCTDGDSNCTCEYFVFAACVDGERPVPADE